MVVVLKGLTIEYAKSHFEKSGTELPFICTNPDAFLQLLIELESVGIPSDNRALSWVKDMLQHDHFARLTAAMLVTSITAPDAFSARNSVFCGICCLSEEESDTSDSLDDPDEGFVET